MIQRTMPFVAVAATAIVTILGLGPIRRFLSKVDGDIARMTLDLFWTMALPRILIGLAFVMVGLALRGSRPILAWLLILSSPLLVVIADLALLALP